MDLTARELTSLRILAFFFYQIGSFESAQRALKCLMALVPQDLWARGLFIACENALEHYEKVLTLTEDLDEFSADKKQYRALIYLRARALQKTNQSAQAQALMARLGGSHDPA